MRQAINLGTAPMTKTGDSPMVVGEKVNEAFEELYLLLSGNSSTITLPNTGIPVSAGGTGSITVQGARENLGLYVDTNNVVVLGTSATKLYDDRLVNSKQRTAEFTMQKLDGKYVIYNASQHALNGFTVVLPKDVLGNVLCGCTVEFDTVKKTATVSVYNVVYEGGKAVLDTSALIDVPDGRCIDISLR